MAIETLSQPQKKSKRTRYLAIAALILVASVVVYGYPLVMMDVTREVITATRTSGEYQAPNEE